MTRPAFVLPEGRLGLASFWRVVFNQESSHAQLTELGRLADEGHLRPQAGAVSPLAPTAEAFSAKAADAIAGRIVLQP